MNGDPGGLDNLRDLALPAAVPYWPPAPGAVVIALALLAVLAIALWRAAERYRASAYRRAALAELESLAAAAPPAAVADVSAVLKRAALVAYPRETTADLSGAAWAQFLARTAPAFESETAAATLSEAFSNRPAPASAREAFLAQARLWVRRHVPFEARA